MFEGGGLFTNQDRTLLLKVKHSVTISVAEPTLRSVLTKYRSHGDATIYIHRVLKFPCVAMGTVTYFLFCLFFGGRYCLQGLALLSSFALLVTVLMGH